MRRGPGTTTEAWSIRALTWLVVAGFVVAVYAVVVRGGGSLLGLDPDEPHLLLSVLATVLVALALEPVEGRVRTAVRRRLQGVRATPYEALTRFASRTADTYALDEVAPRMAHVLVAATGAQSAEVWVAVGPEPVLAGSWPAGACRTTVSVGEDAAVLVLPPAELVVPVHCAGALLGALVVRKPEGEPVTPVEHALVSDLARQAGLVLHNLALTAELERRVREISTRSTELSASRARLAEAQVAERRRLERDIHDGAQQHLVALAVQLRLAQTLIGRAPERAPQVVGDLLRAVDRAQATVTDLARGVYPRTLVARGLVAALEEATRGSPVPTRVSGPADRWPEAVESAAYFACLEAVQNAGKHARASAVHVEVSGGPGELRFRVRDDGTGFATATSSGGSGLQNMVDRVETLGGSLAVRTGAGTGTVVEGRLPAEQPLVAAGADR